jgi:hypothetical protein
MLRQLSKLTNANFKNVISSARILFPNINELIFSKKMEKLIPNANEMFSYDGYDSCGPMSLVIRPYLSHYFPNLEFKVQYTAKGYGRHLEDHVFLVTKIGDEEIIIDPTYKQFLNNPKCDGTTEYSRKLFIESQPFFVGTLKNLEHHVETFATIDKNLFGEVGRLKTDDVLSWYYGNDILPRQTMNLTKMVEDTSKLESYKNDKLDEVVAKIREDLDTKN